MRQHDENPRFFGGLHGKSGDAGALASHDGSRRTGNVHLLPNPDGISQEAHILLPSVRRMLQFSPVQKYSSVQRMCELNFCDARSIHVARRMNLWIPYSTANTHGILVISENVHETFTWSMGSKVSLNGIVRSFGVSHWLWTNHCGSVAT